MNDSLKLFFEVFGKMSEDENVLFIVDNCSADKSMTKKKQIPSESAFSGRHVNCSVWVLTQKYNSVLTDLREHTKVYTKDRDSFNGTLRENDVIPSLEARNDLRKKLGKQRNKQTNKHSKLILITEQPTTYRWEKLFRKIIIKKNGIKNLKRSI